MHDSRPQPAAILPLGDAIVILLITVAGFASHGEGTAFLRMFTTFIPLCVGWGLSAGMLGLYRTESRADLRRLWKPAAAALLGVPLATWLRGAWLGAPILPLFVLVLLAVTAVSMTAWRGVLAVLSRVQAGHG